MTRQFRASLFVAVTALVGLHFRPCIGSMFGAVSEALACTAASSDAASVLPATSVAAGTRARTRSGADAPLPAPDAISARPALASLSASALSGATFPAGVRGEASRPGAAR